MTWTLHTRILKRIRKFFADNGFESRTNDYYNHQNNLHLSVNLECRDILHQSQEGQDRPFKTQYTHDVVQSWNFFQIHKAIKI